MAFLETTLVILGLLACFGQYRSFTHTLELQGLQNLGPREKALTQKINWYNLLCVVIVFMLALSPYVKMTIQMSERLEQMNEMAKKAAATYQSTL